MLSTEDIENPLSAAYSETVLRHSSSIGFYREQAASQAVAGIARRRRRRNVQNVEMLAAESAVGDVLCGHFDDAVDLSGGRDSDNARATPPAIPNIALFIDG